MLEPFDAPEKPQNKGGRPRKQPDPLDEVLPCFVADDASLEERQAAAAQATSTKWTQRRAYTAAGVDRATLEEWLDDPDFARRYFWAQQDFIEAHEEKLLQMATGRAGRVPRATIQALQAFLSSHAAAYSRSRADALLRQTGAMQDAILRVLRAHVPAAVLEQIQAEFTKMRDAIEGSGGTRARA